MNNKTGQHNQQQSSNASAGNFHTNGRSGSALPAIPAVQQKEADHTTAEEHSFSGSLFHTSAKQNASVSAMQLKPNTTGMPDSLKSGVEDLSGMDLSDVKVHYNSSQPAQLNALAYAQGNDIHIGAGQEKHLPHEAWHVVQQRQGRVEATTQLKQGVAQAPALKSDGRDIVQRKAYVGAKKIIKAYEDMEKDAEVMATTEQIKDPTLKHSAFMEDAFKRNYKDLDQFTKHGAGEPVDVGLIRHLALWYELPFDKGFFVLGENHGVLGYRELVEESNQTKDVLGESKSVPIGYYATAREDRDKVDKTMTLASGANEYAMESILSKTLFALIVASKNYKKQIALVAAAAAAPAAVVQPDTVNELPEAWLAGKKDHEVKRNDRKIPYYEADGKHVYLKSENVVPAANYNVLKTALGVIDSCLSRIDEYYALKGDDAKVPETGLVALRASLSTIKAQLPQAELTVLDQAAKTNLADVLFPDAIAKCEVSAEWEMSKANIKNGADEVAAVHMQVKGARNKPVEVASSMRDVYMFEGIMKAKEDGYLMAGIGDNHAEFIENMLKDNNVPVIRYADFFTDKYTKDAL